MSQSERSALLLKVIEETLGALGSLHLREYLAHADEPAAKLESVRTKCLPWAEARTARLNVFVPVGAQLAVDGIEEYGSAMASPTGSPMASIVIAAVPFPAPLCGSVALECWPKQHVSARSGLHNEAGDVPQKRRHGPSDATRRVTNR
jgi:hypothetical protein